MHIPLFAQIVQTQTYICLQQPGIRRINGLNTDTLLGTYAGQLAVKTGIRMRLVGAWYSPQREMVITSSALC